MSKESYRSEHAHVAQAGGWVKRRYRQISKESYRSEHAHVAQAGIEK